MKDGKKWEVVKDKYQDEKDKEDEKHKSNVGVGGWGIEREKWIVK